MSATTPDVPLHPHTDRWVFRSGGESGRVSRAERRGVYGDDEARRACADAGEKPDRPWHRTTSSSRILTLRSRRVKAFLSLGEFAHDATAGIFNDYVALQVWAGTPAGRAGQGFGWIAHGRCRWGRPCRNWDSDDSRVLPAGAGARREPLHTGSTTSRRMGSDS